MSKKYHAFKLWCAFILLTGIFIHSQNLEQEKNEIYIMENRKCGSS